MMVSDEALTKLQERIAAWPMTQRFVVQQLIEDYSNIRKDLLAYKNTGLTPEQCENAKVIIEAAFSDDTSKAEWIRELLKADKDGRVCIIPESVTGTCGSCENFERIPETQRGTCRAHYYCKNRYGQIDERRGRFTPAQSHNGCKQYKPRGGDDG